MNSATKKRINQREYKGHNNSSFKIHLRVTNRFNMASKRTEKLIRDKE